MRPFKNFVLVAVVMLTAVFSSGCIVRSSHYKQAPDISQEKRNNQKMIQDACVVFNEMKDISEIRKLKLQSVVAELLAKAPDLGEDKTKNFPEHLRVYAADTLSRPKMTENEYVAIVETFRWSLQNYINLPPMTPEQKDLAVFSLVKKEMILADIMKKHYPSLSERGQTILNQEIHKISHADEVYIGNYFYSPDLVYVCNKNLDKDTLPAISSLENFNSSIEMILNIQEDTLRTQEVKDEQIRSLLKTDARDVYNKLSSRFSKFFFDPHKKPASFYRSQSKELHQMLTNKRM